MVPKYSKNSFPSGVFIVKGKEDALATRNMVIGDSVYGEKRVTVEDEKGKVEYRIWNPFRSKLAAAMLGGLESVHIEPGTKLLYLGAASGTTVSHCSDMVGQVCLNSSYYHYWKTNIFLEKIWHGNVLQDGLVYAVEFSYRSGRDLINVAKKRPNIVPIIEDARHPQKYRMIVGQFVWFICFIFLKCNHHFEILGTLTGAFSAIIQLKLLLYLLFCRLVVISYVSDICHLSYSFF